MNTRPSVSLEGAGFPGSVCKTLTRLGFQTPTPAQAATWPILRQGRGLTIIVSPPNSGKTLTYLLPLVTSREVSHPRVDVPHPRLVVVVRSSWGVQAVHTRAVELMSAQSAHRRFRYITLYNTPLSNLIHGGPSYRACAAYKAQGKVMCNKNLYLSFSLFFIITFSHFSLYSLCISLFSPFSSCSIPVLVVMCECPRSGHSSSSQWCGGVGLHTWVSPSAGGEGGGSA